MAVVSLTFSVNNFLTDVQLINFIISVIELFQNSFTIPQIRNLHVKITTQNTFFLAWPWDIPITFMCTNILVKSTNLLSFIICSSKKMEVRCHFILINFYCIIDEKFEYWCERKKNTNKQISGK